MGGWTLHGLAQLGLNQGSLRPGSNPSLKTLFCGLTHTLTARFVHNKFLSVAPEEGGVKGLSFPLLEDVNGDIAEKYGVLRKDSGYTFRGYFLIDSEGIIRMRTVYDLPVGIGCERLPETIKAVQDALREDTWFETN